MIIFLSGAINHDPNYKKHFDDAEKEIREKSNHEVINPARFEYPESMKDRKHEDEIMDVCKAYLNMAHAIYLLRGWETSAGSKEELRYFLSKPPHPLFDAPIVFVEEGGLKPWMKQ